MRRTFVVLATAVATLIGTVATLLSTPGRVWVYAPSSVDIDHMVPLANAWRSGAKNWTTDRRRTFANDLNRGQLIAVTASSNRAKGDQDPSQWRPSNTNWWCYYARHWIDVKYDYYLTVTSSEKSALYDMMRYC